MLHHTASLLLLEGIHKNIKYIFYTNYYTLLAQQHNSFGSKSVISISICMYY